MSFLIGLIVNGILLSIPIGASLGTMLAIRPFRNEIVPLTTAENAIVQTSFCDDSHTFHQFSQNKAGVNYTGEWGRSSILAGHIGEAAIMPRPPRPSPKSQTPSFWTHN